MRIASSLLLTLGLFLTPAVSTATLPWPGEPWQQSINLTSLDDDFVANASGADWNAETRTFWVCINSPGKFIAMIPDGAGGYKVDQRNGARAEWAPGGDLEGIAVGADLKAQSIYLLVEGEDAIRQYDTSSYGVVKLLRSWSIKPFVPTVGGTGSEGLAFVPDSWLTVRGFVDAAGQPRVSRNGQGGLWFVAHQNGGGIYVFDLAASAATVDFVGAYKTLRTESSGLDFDRSTGRLMVWHNIGSNYLEEVDLASTALAGGGRQLNSLREFAGPKGGNLEGIAMSPAAGGEHLAFVTDDGNDSGFAVMAFSHFAPNRASLDVRISASADDAEESATGVVNLVSSDLELTRDASTQTVAMRFNGITIPAGARITAAHIQFAVDEANAEVTTLSITGQAVANAPALVARSKTLSTRVKTAAAVAWSPAAWSVIGEIGPAQRTPDLSTVVQEVIRTAGWLPGNSVVIIIAGKGKRVARSYDGNRAAAPLLHIEYEQ